MKRTKRGKDGEPLEERLEVEQQALDPEALKRRKAVPPPQGPVVTIADTAIRLPNPPRDQLRR